MKLTRLKIVGAALVIMIAGVSLLFLTDAGLIVQAKLAERLGCPSYWFFIIKRLPDNPNAMYFSAQEFERLALEDLFTARQMADRAIQLNPTNSIYYYQRGHINVTARRYAEARKDFEMGLNCWQYNFERIPTQADLSNTLVEATGCLQAHTRAWGKTDQ